MMSRAGNKAFDRCDVKTVEFNNYVFSSDVESEDISSWGGYRTAGSKTKDRILITPENHDEVSNNWDGGSEAVLRCPMTEDRADLLTSSSNNHSDKLDALKSLRNIAGELVCRNCRFSDMTPVEVSIERKKLAEAESERIEAFIHLSEAQADLAQIEPPHLLDNLR